MTRYLILDELLELYRQIMAQSGGLVGIQNVHALESALAQPHATFDGLDLYATISEKAAILGFTLIRNHPFIDGNKRIGHAAVEIFLIVNGYEIQAPIDEQETIILQVAAGTLDRSTFTTWLHKHVVPYNPGSEEE